LAKALVAGVVVHIAVAVVAQASLPRRHEGSALRSAETWSVELVETALADAAAPLDAPAPATGEGVGHGTFLGTRVRSAGTRKRSEEQGASSTGVVESTTAGEEEALLVPTVVEQGEATAPRAIDFGLNGRFALLPPPDRARPSRAERVQQRLDASLAGSGGRGQSRGAVLIGPLSSAGPPRGSAVLRVVVDAQGSLSSAEIVGGSRAEWAGMLRALREQARSKRVALPPGARGMTLTFRVTAGVTQSSGKRDGAAAVETEKPSFEPDGLTLRGGFDVADASGALHRVVTSELLSEEAL
jgi:hypothetical protein